MIYTVLYHYDVLSKIALLQAFTWFIFSKYY